ncbi:MAG: flagellar hook-associated protein FlgL [Desulfobacterales bacterium]|uniref:Flagellar hook-associated protein FlgL n=1 Tax=Candidatus Desulfatibia profunda TaxID=2841695 RepID=A0A8J6TMI7_9BACT|nr:flagellar hook-associated protein FlgL [Candidatus Desulfatibia profunda]MBL7180557.1 flagellar hook-associated protein FlgL [Desulfobacterales bacterium]
MRVANKSVFDVATYHLGNIIEELNKASNIVSTGKRINELSDDPVGIIQALGIRTTLANIEQVRRNISLGNSWLAASESALSQTQDIVSYIKSLAVQMANASIDSAQRVAAAQTVQNMLEEIVSLANTDVSGRYIFAGTKTDTVAFSQNGTYNGDNNAFTIKIGKDATMAVGSDGQAVFESIFTTLSTFKTALEANNISGIGEAMTNLDADFNSITVKISDVGSKMLRMEVKEKILEDSNVSNTERLSKIEDADIVEAIMNLKAIEFAYQATLASSAKVMTLSLADYLK